MTYEVFHAIAKEVVNETENLGWGFDTSENFEFFEVRWRVGGTGGGNCWEPDGHYGLSADPEPEFVFLDKLLEMVCPNISFLVYKNLCSTVVEMRDSSEYEYYGNHTDYRHKKVDLRKLYTYLLQKGVI